MIKFRVRNLYFFPLLFGAVFLLGCNSLVKQSLIENKPVRTISSGPVDFDQYRITRPDSLPINYYVSKNSGKLPLILFLQGSGCQPVFFRSSSTNYGSTVYNLLPTAVNGKFSVMVVEKPGSIGKPDISTANGCSPAFNKHFTAQNWVNDVELALNQARKISTIDGSRILILGVSEGATVAAALAASDKDITNVALIGATGPSQFYDFVVNIYRSAISDAEKNSKLNELEATRKKIDKNPDSYIDFAWGHPYNRWSSFFAMSSTQNLLKSRARVYLVSGMQDVNVPILSTESMAAELITSGHDVTVRRIPLADHSLLIPGGKSVDVDNEYNRIFEWFSLLPSKG